MCGIVGAVANRNVVSTLIEGLSRLDSYWKLTRSPWVELPPAIRNVKATIRHRKEFIRLQLKTPKASFTGPWPYPTPINKIAKMLHRKAFLPVAAWWYMAMNLTWIGLIRITASLMQLAAAYYLLMGKWVKYLMPHRWELRLRLKLNPIKKINMYL